MKSSRSHEPSGSNAWAWMNSAEMHCVLMTSSCHNYNHKPVYKQQNWRCDSCLLFLFFPWFSVNRSHRESRHAAGAGAGVGVGAMGGGVCLSVCPPNSIRTDGRTDGATDGRPRQPRASNIRPYPSALGWLSHKQIKAPSVVLFRLIWKCHVISKGGDGGGLCFIHG